MKLQFVNVSSHEAGRSGGRPGYTNDDERRRRIRTHVMRDFRRKERLFNTQLNKQASQKSGGRGQAIQYADSAVRVPPSIHCPQIWRSSFAHVLVDGWFPTDIGYAPLLKNNIAYAYTAHDSAAVVAIHDAVLILPVGSIAGNEGLLLEARKRYVAAVGGLRVNTSQVRPTTPLGTLLLVAMGALMSETYSPIATISVPIDWQKHIIGISALVSNYSKRCQSSPLDNYLLQQIWATQLIYALVTRKPFHDTLAIARIPSSSFRVNKLLDLASSIPQLLQDVDANSNLGHCGAKDALEKRLFHQRDALSGWLNAFGASNGHDGLTSSKSDREVGSSTHPRNARSLLCGLICETLCCICLLLLTESIHDLESSYILPDTDLTRHAGYLMNATSSLAKAAIVPICVARAISGPLFFLKRVYARIGDSDGLHWCEQMQRKAYEQATFLHWDALLPWSLITLHGIPHYDVRAGLE